ncbi:MAG: hypothetical protein FWG20_07030 [Candidatus Cloacimonetes bacterium]|nr:hypothetical protein [Candidatus Cloacimonadota bacterium]
MRFTHTIPISKIRCLLFFTIIFCLIFIVSCGKEKQDEVVEEDLTIETLYLDVFNMDSYDLVVKLKYSENKKNNILVSSTGTEPLNFFSLKVNNDQIKLDKFADNYDGFYNFLEGKAYNLEINYNYTTYKTRLAMPYKVTLDPTIEDFDASLPYRVAWSSDKDNQLQSVNLHSYTTTGADFYSVYVGPKARHFTFEPVIKSLQNGIVGVSVENINYIKEDRILIYSSVESYMDEKSKSIYNE